MNTNLAAQVFEERFGEAPTYLVRAPGRVNLIGEHTDYNLGYSLPMAIDRALWIALRPRTDRMVSLTSLNFPEPAHFNLEAIQPNASWANYVHGMAWALQESGYLLNGWEGVLSSDLPVASGLSSSAALEIGVARAFWALSQWDWEHITMAQTCIKCDHEWLGIKSGFLDQLTSMIGEAGKAFLIDFQDLTYIPVPLPKGTAIVVLDTKVERPLLDSAYNARVDECQHAADYFGVESLRDVSLERFQTASAGLDEIPRRRAHHVITENIRTLEAAERMQANNPRGLGTLMNASHTSLRDDYEVSCPELDLMVELSRKEQGCYGARMTGAGFGGCAIAMVEATRSEGFSQAVASAYRAKTGLHPDTYICQPAAGAEVVINM